MVGQLLIQKETKQTEEGDPREFQIDVVCLSAAVLRVCLRVFAGMCYDQHEGHA